MPEPTPSKAFLAAVSSVSNDLSPRRLREHFDPFYDEARQLSVKFTDNDPSVSPYSGLVSVFHPAITNAGADVAIVRARAFNPDTTVSDADEDSIQPLPSGVRHNKGDKAFVQNGLTGFKKNWNEFTHLALADLNWYVSPWLHTN